MRDWFWYGGGAELFFGSLAVFGIVYVLIARANERAKERREDAQHPYYFDDPEDHLK